MHHHQRLGLGVEAADTAAAAGGTAAAAATTALYVLQEVGEAPQLGLDDAVLRRCVLRPCGGASGGGGGRRGGTACFAHDEVEDGHLVLEDCQWLAFTLPLLRHLYLIANNQLTLLEAGCVGAVVATDEVVASVPMLVDRRFGQSADLAAVALDQIDQLALLERLHRSGCDEDQPCEAVRRAAR